MTGWQATGKKENNIKQQERLRHSAAYLWCLGKCFQMVALSLMALLRVLSAAVASTNITVQRNI